MQIERLVRRRGDERELAETVLDVLRAVKAGVRPPGARVGLQVVRVRGGVRGVKEGVSPGLPSSGGPGVVAPKRAPLL